jgi:Outer membrane protein beta-barrel domain
MRHVLASLAPLAVAPLVAVSLAAAPAAADPLPSGPPGACDCSVPVPTAAPAAPELPRWAIGLSLSSTSLNTKDGGADTQTQWGGGGLEARYRIAPRWELGVAFEGARERLADGSQGDRMLALDTVSARYHFNPYARWDLYAIAGVGAAQIRDVNDGSSTQAPVRGAGELGGGLERRFGHIGVAAELRLVAIAAPKDAGGAMTSPVTSGANPPPPGATADPAQAGATLTLGAAYHF